MGIAERKGREKEIRRQQILEAGEIVFIEKGLQNATMDEIAHLCELSKGTLYLYFKSKEDLFLVLLIKGHNLFIEMLKKNLAKCSSFEEKFQVLGTTYLNFYKKHRNYYRLMNSFESHEPARIDNPKKYQSDANYYEVFLKTQETWETIVQVIKEGMDEGFLKKDIDPLEVGVILWGASNGLINLLDHFTHSHKNFKPEKLFSPADKNHLKYAYQFLKIDFEKMLIHTWNLIISSILVKKVKK